MPELWTAPENARLEIGPQRDRNSHQIGVLGIYDLQGLSYGRTELLVADMRHLEPDPSDTPLSGGATQRPYTRRLTRPVAQKSSPLDPQPSPLS